MELQRAINILEPHNRWRRGEIEKMYYTVKELGEAIDMILKEAAAIEIKKNCTHSYTIIHENKVFYSDYFDEENLFVKGMIIINNLNDTFFDGVSWQEIEEDHL